MEKEKSFSQMCGSSVEELKGVLLEERDALMRIRFSKKMGDSKGYGARAVRKKIARIKTALSTKKKGGS